MPWTAAYVDSRGDPTCELRSNIAAESRAKIVCERLINITDDPGIKDALGGAGKTSDEDFGGAGDIQEAKQMAMELSAAKAGGARPSGRKK